MEINIRNRIVWNELISLQVGSRLVAFNHSERLVDEYSPCCKEHCGEHLTVLHLLRFCELLLLLLHKKRMSRKRSVRGTDVEAEFGTREYQARKAVTDWCARVNAADFMEKSKDKQYMEHTHLLMLFAKHFEKADQEAAMKQAVRNFNLAKRTNWKKGGYKTATKERFQQGLREMTIMCNIKSYKC